MRPQPMIVVSDVARSSAWYQQVLGATSGHGGNEYEMLLVEGTLVLQLHDRATDHHHGGMGDPALPYGNGCLLWFETDAFDAAVERATKLGAAVVKAPHVNPNARQREIWLADPDGFVVVLASGFNTA